MKQPAIPGVEYLSVQQTQAQIAKDTGKTIAEVRESEQELTRKGYGYCLNHQVWMFPKPFADDANWTPPARVSKS